MSKGRREAPNSAAARLCEWRALNWSVPWQRQARSAESRVGAALRMARAETGPFHGKGRREAPNSAAARLCEWRALNWSVPWQRQARSAESRVGAALRMARAETGPFHGKGRREAPNRALARLRPARAETVAIPQKPPMSKINASDSSVPPAACRRP